MVVCHIIGAVQLYVTLLLQYDCMPHYWCSTIVSHIIGAVQLHAISLVQYGFKPHYFVTVHAVFQNQPSIQMHAAVTAQTVFSVELYQAHAAPALGAVHLLTGKANSTVAPNFK